jgi:UDP-galactopyranose mutase
VKIADTADGFVCEIEEILSATPTPKATTGLVDEYLTRLSWDRTWESMMNLIQETMGKKLAGRSEIQPPNSPIWQGAILGEELRAGS